MTEPPPALRNHFFALLPPPGVRDALAAIAQALPAAVGGRPEPAHRLHLTLLFLGPLPAAAHDDTLRAAGHAARTASAPFEVELDHLGRFARSDAVWAGPSTAAQGERRGPHFNAARPNRAREQERLKNHTTLRGLPALAR